MPLRWRAPCRPPGQPRWSLSRTQRAASRRLRPTLRSSSSFDFPAAFQGPAERELVGIFQISADRKAAGDTGDLEGQMLQQRSEVHRRGVAFDVRIGAENDFGDSLCIDAVEQFADSQLV